MGVFRRYLDEKLDLARWIEAEIGKIPQLEILAPAALSILAFAVRDKGQSLAERNNATRALMKRINDKQRVNLTGTLLREVFAIRIAVLAFRLHQDRMNMLLEDLQGALAAVGPEVCRHPRSGVVQAIRRNENVARPTRRVIHSSSAGSQQL